MKLIIAGSRTISIEPVFIKSLLIYYGIYKNVKEIISGTCFGVDKSGENFVLMHNLKYFDDKILLKKYPADWKKYGKSAGYIRNKEMAKYGDVLLLIWDGESKGSKNIKEEMLKLNKPVYEVVLRKYEKNS